MADTRRLDTRQIAASPSALIALQQSDGSWGYREGSSWVESTALALMALAPSTKFKDAAGRGLDWLLTARLSDGSWPARLGIEFPSAASALALIALLEYRRHAAVPKSIDRLVSVSGAESSLLVRLRGMLLSGNLPGEKSPEGWPWVPGAAAWSMPTAWAMMALKKFLNSDHPHLTRVEQIVRARIEDGERYLESRVCDDGGWNHGANAALGYEAPAYPETTGAALLGLAGSKSAILPKAILSGQEMLAATRSARAAAWLRLGLAAHGQEPPLPQDLLCRDVVDVSLTLLANAATDGRNAMIEG